MTECNAYRLFDPIDLLNHLDLLQIVQVVVLCLSSTTFNIISVIAVMYVSNDNCMMMIVKWNVLIEFNNNISLLPVASGWIEYISDCCTGLLSVCN